jgi:hypothetical protein
MTRLCLLLALTVAVAALAYGATREERRFLEDWRGGWA